LAILCVLLAGLFAICFISNLALASRRSEGRSASAALHHALGARRRTLTLVLLTESVAVLLVAGGLSFIPAKGTDLLLSVLWSNSTQESGGAHWRWMAGISVGVCATVLLPWATPARIHRRSFIRGLSSTGLGLVGPPRSFFA